MNTRAYVIAVALALAACTSPASPTGPAAPVADPPGVPANAEPSDFPEPTDPGGAMTLTVMSYNVLGGVPPQSWFPTIDPAELDPLAREPGTVGKIKDANPDIVGLQEYRPEFESGVKMAADLSEYTWLAPTNPNKENVAVPLLYRTSRFAQLDAGHELVTPPADDCTGGMERYAAWVKLRDLKTGRTITAINTHLCPFQNDLSADIRSKSIDRIVALVNRIDPELADPLVLLGDFNAHSNETRGVYKDHLAKLQAIGLADAATTRVKDTSDVARAGSYNGMQASVNGRDHAKVIRLTNRHMDYIWVPEKTKVATWATVSGPGVASRTIDGKKVSVWTGVIPSDHSPVVAKVTFAG